jgi:hypothetical protein
MRLPGERVNEVIKRVGRGWLLVAVGGLLAACGDDQFDAHGGDGGARDAAAGRPADGGSAGRDGGASGRGGTDAGAVDGGGAAVTPDECRERAVRTAGAACVACVCDAGPHETVACGPGCWALVACIQVDCGGDGSDIPCISERCADFLAEGAPAQALEFDPVIRMCASPCLAPLHGGDLDVDGGR